MYQEIKSITKKAGVTLGLVGFCLTFSFTAHGTTIGVPSDQPDIQSGINVATSGDTVLVAPGTYTESIDFLGKSVTVLSSDGPRQTVITNSSANDLVVFSNGETSSSLLEGFTLKDGRIGIMCTNSGPTIRGNILDGQKITNWGAISLSGASPIVIENNTIINCSNGAISTFSSVTPIIRNNILAFNTSYAIHRQSVNEAEFPHPVMEYNCVFGNGIEYQNITPGIGVVALDPQLDTDNSLLPGSPCIDAGDPAPAFSDPDGSRNDIGAVPFPQAGPFVSNLNLGSGVSLNLVPTTTPTFFWSYADNNLTTQSAYEIEVGSDADWSVAELWATGPVTSSDTSALYAGSALANRMTYYVRARVSDGVNWGPWSSIVFSVAIIGTINVPADFLTIQAAIDAALNGDTIVVAPGTYTEVLSINAKSVILKSEGGPQVTTITADAGSNVITVTGDNGVPSVIEGFTIQGGRIGILCENSGPSIKRNILTGQNIIDWGAISLGGASQAIIGASPATIVNNTIINCANGAISTFSSVQPTIRNNILAFNSSYAIHRQSTNESTTPHPVMEYNCVFGNGVDYQNITPGVGVIALNPLLNTDNSLLAGSPCIDAGDPDPSFNDPDGSRNNIGAISTSTTLVSDTIRVPFDSPTIQAGINAVLPGGVVVVGPGVYSENLNLGSKSLTLVSSDGSATTIISSPVVTQSAPTFEFVDSSFVFTQLGRSSAVGPVITLLPGSGSGIVIDGFTIDGGNSVTGLVCEGSDPTIQNCEFRNCFGVKDGGAMWFNFCAPKVLNNVFHDNVTPISGSSVFVRLGVGNGTAVVTGNTMFNNTSGNGPAVSLIEGDDALVSYNLAYNNIATAGSTRRGAIYVRGADINIHNNTVDGNTVGVTVLSSANVDVRNNIITNSLDIGLEYLSDVGPNVSVTNNFNDSWSNAGGDYFASTAGGNAISADPIFVSGYSLAAGSPCIDAGDPSSSFNDPDGSRNDMGALPTTQNGPFVSGLNLGAGVSLDTVPTVTPMIHWSYFDTNPTTQSAYQVEVGTDNDWTVAELWSTGSVTGSDTAVLYAGAALANHTTSYLRVRVSDGLNFGPWSALAFMVVAPGTIHVPTDFSTIQAAIDVASSGDSIIVGPGVYSENLDFGSKSLILVSSDGSATTTISSPAVAQSAPTFEFVDSNFVFSTLARGSAVSPVITILPGSDSGVVIDGFTVDGGNSVTGLSCEGSNPTVKNCEFRNCFGVKDGGAMWFNFCAPKVLNNVFHDNVTPISGSSIFVRLGTGNGTAVVTGNTMFNNTSGNGPAVSLIEGDDAVVSFNLAYDNVATAGSTRRGAIYVRGADIAIFNNTLNGNTVGLTVLSSVNVDVRNNIITNSVDIGLEYLSDVGSNVSVTNDFNDSWNNAGGDYFASTAGGNAISADPIFVSGFSLAAGSPCVDAGDPGSSFNDPDGSRNDMGALPGTQSGPFVTNLNLGAGVSPDMVPTVTPMIHWSYFDANPTVQSAYQVEVGTDNDWTVAELWSTGSVSGSDTAVLYAGPALSNYGSYSLRVRVSDGVGFGPWSALSFTVSIPGTIHVPADFSTIQAAIDAATGGDSIIVGPGVYSESLDITEKSVHIKSESGSMVTIITSSSSSDLVTFRNDGGNVSSLDGFTLLGGRIGILCENAGPIITHNILRDQNITNWGAISLGGDGNGTDGPSPAVIVNNTIVGCANGAISTFSTAQPTVKNNILAFNAHYAIHRNSTSSTYPHPIMEYNSVFGNGVDYQNITPGVGVITTDPKLSIVMTILIESPCIDAGDPAPSFNDPDGSRNDIGASPYTCCSVAGDANNDFSFNIADVMYLIDFIFQGGPASSCSASVDPDVSGEVNIADVTYLVASIFSGGKAPVCGTSGS